MRTNDPSISSDSSQTYQRKKWQSRLWRFFLFVSLSLVAGFLGMTLLLLGLRTLPLPDESFLHPTRLYGANGDVLTEWSLRGTHSAHVSLARIPRDVQAATLAVEDAKFYQHRALNLKSMARALLVDIRNHQVVEGGSTITQQLAKNLFLTQSRTLGRKLHEALLAIQLEMHESKQTILEQYLNVVYYGHGAYGIGAASELYFNKPPENLTLAESAMLAGLPKGPSLYSPLTNFRAARERQRIVLDRMIATGYITQQEADRAFQAPIHINALHPPMTKAPYFSQMAMAELAKKYHLTSEDLDRGGYQITTTLDPLLQAAAERAIRTSLPQGGHLQAALVAMDPKTGAIKALVGGHDFATSPYNRAFAERQPGSTFKAILYSSALEHGWTPANQVNSVLTTFMYDQSKTYTVHDYEDFFAHRPLTLREALARSDNVYAVTTNLEVGPENVINMARRMGISTPLKPYPALALGVFSTSPVQMATAYAALANGGFQVKPFAIDKVGSVQSPTVIHARPQVERVLSADVAYQMTDLLHSVLEPNGTGYGIHQYLHGKASAKTGTTDSDSWMVGFTPTVVCAVWVGYDNNQPLSTLESHLAGPIWAKFMGTAQERLPATWPDAPATLVKRTIDPLNGKLATDTCAVTETDYFIKGTEPTETCPLHPALASAKKRSPWYRNWLSKWL